MPGSNLPAGVTGVEEYFGEEGECPDCGCYVSSQGPCRSCREDRIADENEDVRNGSGS